MSTLLKKLLQVAVPVSTVAVMSLAAGNAVAGISNTKHFLGFGGTANHVAATDTEEICVFCHTPHGGDTSTPGVPLWNKKLTAGPFSTYSSSTMDAISATDGVAGSTAIGSVSLACLSCHDGTQAMDNILNAPGSGGYDSTGGGTNGRSYTWTSPSGRVDANGKLGNGGGFIAALGTDLTNDHPIGIDYCGWVAGGTTPAAGTDILPANCGDKDFKTAQAIPAKLQWYVDAGGLAPADNGKQKTDMILYTRAFGAKTGPSVECASCHDVHSEAPTFLRTSNASSAVCLACHDK